LLLLRAYPKQKNPASKAGLVVVNTLLHYVRNNPGQYFLSFKNILSYNALCTGRPATALHGDAIDISVSVLLAVCCNIIGCYYPVLNLFNKIRNIKNPGFYRGLIIEISLFW